MAGVTEEYDVFLSYARDDDELEVITRLSDDIRAVFQQRTRRQLRIFVDRQEIPTAQLWQERISSALHGSSLLVAVVTENYLVSQWCRHEWDYFAAQERGLSEEADYPRIFPVFLHGEPELASPSPAVQKWMRAIKSRQCANLAGGDGDSQLLRERISRFTDDLIIALEQRWYRRLLPRITEQAAERARLQP